MHISSKHFRTDKFNVKMLLVTTTLMLFLAFVLCKLDSDICAASTCTDCKMLEI